MRTMDPSFEQTSIALHDRSIAHDTNNYVIKMLNHNIYEVVMFIQSDPLVVWADVDRPILVGQ